LKEKKRVDHVGRQTDRSGQKKQRKRGTERIGHAHGNFKKKKITPPTKENGEPQVWVRKRRVNVNGVRGGSKKGTQKIQEKSPEKQFTSNYSFHTPHQKVKNEELISPRTS